MKSKRFCANSESAARVLIVAPVMLLLAGTIARAGGVQIRFLERPPQRARLLDKISIRWVAVPQAAGTECRYKLDVPGDWTGGIRYAMQKWSQWGPCEGSTLYTNFVKEGRYHFTVEARSGKIGRVKASCEWQMYWEYPEIRGEALRIDVARVRSARNKREKYRILADEYHKMYDMSMREFQYEAQLLKLTTSPRELVMTVAGALIGKNNGATIQAGIDVAREFDMAAAAGQGVALQRVLLPKTIYDIIKQGVVDLILVYRRARANAACSRAVVAYYGWQHFERKAQGS